MLLWGNSVYLKGFKEFKQTQNSGFVAYKHSLNQQFFIYKNTLQKEFKLYKQTLQKYWNNPEFSTKTTFVGYFANNKIKQKIDYKNNIIKIYVIAKNKQIAQKQIKQSFDKLSKMDVSEAFMQNPALVKTDKILQKSFSLKASRISKTRLLPLKQAQIIKISSQIDKNTKKLSSSKIKQQNIYLFEVKLPSDFYIAKAKEFKNDVFLQSKKFSLNPAVVYAIIQTESSFNPMATSYVPAFGLMQIVPRSAGADAYEMLTGTKTILTPSYLYNSKNNILIGSAYFYKLYYVYLKGIKNPISRLYCAICAYNGGAGSVACAFNAPNKKCIRVNKDYSIQKAIPKINSFTQQQVYEYLTNNLKHQETKNYLKKVNINIYKYEKAIQKNEI